MVEIEGYELGELLYESGASVVHRAVGAGGDPVVLKTTASDYPKPADVARLRREYSLGSSLGLEGVTSYLGSVASGRSLVLVLEDFGAVSLSALLCDGPFEIDRLLDVAVGLARALAGLHAEGIIHRDISPGNVFFNPATGTLKIGDLGLASRIPRSRQVLVPANRLQGTIAYVSPEQTGRMNRAIDYRTDLYSLGATLYHLAVGQTPFEGSDIMSVVHGHIARLPTAPSDLRSELPAALGRIILRLMAKAAEDRYQSADALAGDLDALRAAWRQGSADQFTPSADDVGLVFTLSEQLYGRAPQVRSLLSAFDRVADGACELLLVTGQAGIGKSFLVSEVHRSMVARRGNFATGKFDQYGRHRPLSALADALSDLLRNALASDEDELERWRSRISQALGAEAGALVEVLPELELVLGELPPIDDLHPTQARERFDRLMGAFLRAFAGPEHPLVVFLDDLQWVDPASLRLVTELVTDEETDHLLFIGAYRDDEVDAAHPLSVALGQLGEATVETLHLGPLDPPDIAALISDSTERSIDDSAPLADLLHQKTGGNPFFLTRFLLDLVDDDLLTLRRDPRAWVWDIDTIRQREAAETAVQLMVSKLTRYGDACQGLLRVAACMGSTFELEHLATVGERSIPDLATALWEPVRDGLVLPLGAAYDLFRGDELPDEATLRFKFAHDRIQEAAWASVPVEEREGLHLRIGRLIRSGIAEGDRAERIFDFIEHFNRAADLLPADEHRALADWNLEAAERAKASTAYAAAVRHLERAIDLLRNDWDAQPEALAAAHRQRVECIYLTGNTEGALAAFAEVSEQVTDIADVAGLCQVVMRILVTENRIEEALQEGLRCLGQLGAGPPADPDAVGARMGELGAGIGAMIGEKGPRALVEGPRATDAEVMAISGVLQEAWICALMASNLPMVAFTTLSVVHQSLEHGITSASPAGYVAQAALCALQGDYDGARMFGSSGLELADVLDDLHLRPMVLNTYGNFTGHMVAPLQQNVDRYEASYRACLRTGDRWWGAWAVHWARVHRFLKGDPLDDVHERALAYHAYIVNSGYLPLVLLSNLDLAFFANLMGATDRRDSLDHGDFDEAEMEATLTAANFGYGLYVLHTFRAWLAWLYGEDARALELLDKADPFKDLIPGGPAYASFFFYGGLILAANLEDDSPSERLDRFDEYAGRLAVWAEKGCGETFEHMHELLQGERARLGGDHARALGHYEASTESAHRTGFLHHAAMACELAGRSFLTQGHARAARGYLVEAMQLYGMWGAEAKIAQLREQHPTLRDPRSAGTRSSGTVTSHSVESLGLDIETVMKASHALSQEIKLERLLQALLAILLENAGAERGALLLDSDGELRLQAAGDTDGVEVLQDAPLRDCSDVPRSVVSYVARLQEAVIEPDAAKQGRFNGDPYVQARRVRSMLCLPLLHHGRAVGVLYAENNRVPAAFTRERIELLGMVSAQAAISLENATLYRDLEGALDRQTRLTRSFERFVPKEFLEELGRQSILDVALGDQVQKEMTILFMDIRGFTHLSEILTPQQTFALVNTLLARLGPIVRANGGFIDKYIGDAIMALFPGSVDGAFRAALGIQAAVADLRAEATDGVQAELRVGVGVHSGVTMLGTIGESQRMDSTVISLAVNVASRLEGLTKEKGVDILVSEVAVAALDEPEAFRTRSLGHSPIKGRSESIGVCELMG